MVSVIQHCFVLNLFLIPFLRNRWEGVRIESPYPSLTTPALPHSNQQNDGIHKRNQCSSDTKHTLPSFHKMNVNPEDVLMQGYVLATGENIGYRMGYKRFYFVLTDCLYYYETKESFESRSKPVGMLPLEAFSIAKNETRGRFQLAILASDFSG